MACACRFTSDQKEGLTGVSGVTITTYTMIAFSGKRSEESARVMDQIRSREWGLLLMDEVHVVPAQMFRKVCLRCCTALHSASVLWWRDVSFPTHHATAFQPDRVKLLLSLFLQHSSTSWNSNSSGKVTTDSSNVSMFTCA